MDEILKCDNSNECYRAVLSCAVNYVINVQCGFLAIESVGELLKFDHSDKSYSSVHHS